MADAGSKPLCTRKHGSFRVQALTVAVTACIASFPTFADPKKTVPGPTVPQQSKALQNIDKAKDNKSVISIGPRTGSSAVQQAGPATLVVTPAPVSARTLPSVQVGGTGAAGTVSSISGPSPQAGPSAAVAAPGNSVGAGATGTASPGNSAGGGAVLSGSAGVQTAPSTSSGSATQSGSTGAASGGGSATGASGSSAQPKSVSAAAGNGNINGAENSAANNPVITNSKGETLLAAGKSVELVDPATPNLRVEVTAPEDQTLNLGKIIADTKHKGILAGLHANGKASHSKSAAATADGRIVLKSEQKLVPNAVASNVKASRKDCDTDRRSSGAGPLRTAHAAGNSVTTGKSGNKKSGGDDLASISARNRDGSDVKRLSSDAPTQAGVLPARVAEGNTSQAGASSGNVFSGGGTQGGSPQSPSEPSRVSTSVADASGAATRPASEAGADSKTTAGAGDQTSGACS